MIPYIISFHQYISHPAGRYYIIHVSPMRKRVSARLWEFPEITWLMSDRARIQACSEQSTCFQPLHYPASRVSSPSCQLTWTGEMLPLTPARSTPLQGLTLVQSVVGGDSFQTPGGSWETELITQFFP